MKVKVKYDQRHLYIIILGIYLRCQAAIPNFDILISFGVIAERLNPHVRIYLFCVFRSSWPPQSNIQNSKDNKIL